MMTVTDHISRRHRIISEEDTRFNRNRLGTGTNVTQMCPVRMVFNAIIGHSITFKKKIRTQLADKGQAIEQETTVVNHTVLSLTTTLCVSRSDSQALEPYDILMRYEARVIDICNRALLS